MESSVIQLSPEVQRICSMFHFGWVSRKNLDLEKDFGLFVAVRQALGVMGYELLTTPDWYVIRLRKEFDNDTFDQFHKRYRDINRGHLAMINILYVKLILPTKMKMISDDVTGTRPYITHEEILYNYGVKFQNRKTNPGKRISDIVKVLMKYGFVVQSHAGLLKYEAGPALYMLREELMEKTYETVMRGFVEEMEDSIQESDEEEAILEEEQESD
ncbi:MAG: hypothetical protein H6Q66_2979 [Firmicutes bacterium]|nr:hypothetical protein [Bacillota bacterium]